MHESVSARGRCTTGYLELPLTVDVRTLADPQHAALRVYAWREAEGESRRTVTRPAQRNAYHSCVSLVGGQTSPPLQGCPGRRVAYHELDGGEASHGMRCYLDGHGPASRFCTLSAARRANTKLPALLDLAVHGFPGRALLVMAVDVMRETS